MDVSGLRGDGRQRMNNYDSRPETQQHINKVGRYIELVIQKLSKRADEHDASKLVSPEVEAFDKATPLLQQLEYGTPEYKQSLKDLGPALEHHYANNTHHPEHFENGIRGMTLLDLTEMLCDWKAASERMRKPTPAAEGRPDVPTYDSDFARSIRLNAERFDYPDGLTDILLNTAVELGFIEA